MSSNRCRHCRQKKIMIFAKTVCLIRCIWKLLSGRTFYGCGETSGNSLNHVSAPNFLSSLHSLTAIFSSPLWFRRIMMFIIALPVAQIFLFCYSIGRDPIGLKLAIVNNELNNSMQPCIPGTGCDWSLLSCRYLQHLRKKTIEFLPYDNDEEARYAVTKGWAWGAITFPSNYSESLLARIDYGKDAADWDISFAEMRIVMDMSSKSLNELK